MEQLAWSGIKGQKYIYVYWVVSLRDMVEL